MATNDVTVKPQPAGLADIAAEHALQYKLLAEAEQALTTNRIEDARIAVQQLYSYSDAHFGSEQVIMRLHAYPGYHAHLREHGDLLAALVRLVGDIDTTNALPSAAAIRRWLTAHIHHADQAFVDYLNKPA